MAVSASSGPGGPQRQRGPAQPPVPLLRTVVGEVLRRIRREQGRTLADVARAAKVSLPYLSELERGRKEASSEVLAAICDALRIGLSDLLGAIRHELAGASVAGAGRRAEVIRLSDARTRRATGTGTLAETGEPVGAGGLLGPGEPSDAKCLLAA